MHIVGANGTGAFDRGLELQTEAREGGIIEEIRLENCVRNPQRSASKFDLILYDKVRSEPNLTLMLNTSVTSVQMRSSVNEIEYAIAERISTEDRFQISARTFIDCTGDGRLAKVLKPTEVNVAGKRLVDDELTKWKYQRYMQDYLACVQGVDDGVGRVLDYLDEAKLTDETIVIYLADNGWYLGDLGMYDKRFMYEPGLRVPLIASGPGIKKGSTAAQFVANIDLAPTFLDLAGLPIPKFMQGRSLAPLLRGESPADWSESVYYRYYHDPGHHNTRAHYGVRTKKHKLIYYWTKDAYEMFDIVNDPTEQHNLLFSEDEAKRPEIAAKFEELKAEIDRLQTQFKDDGLYADPATWPKGSADGPFPQKPLGTKSVAEAITLSQQNNE